MSAKILYIEDNKDDFDLLAEAFQEIGAHAALERIPDGMAAVRMVDDFPANAPLPAMLLIDFNLPKIDGATVLARVKSHPQLKQVMTVMLTSSHSTADQERCRAADAYIAKGARWTDCLALARTLQGLIPSPS